MQPDNHEAGGRVLINGSAFPERTSHQRQKDKKGTGRSTSPCLRTTRPSESPALRAGPLSRAGGERSTRCGAFFAGHLSVRPSDAALHKLARQIQGKVRQPRRRRLVEVGYQPSWGTVIAQTVSGCRPAVEEATIPRRTGSPHEPQVAEKRAVTEGAACPAGGPRARLGQDS